MTSANIHPLFQNALTLPASASPHPPKLLNQVRNKIRFKHYSLRTEQAYVHWIRRFILLHNKRHPAEMSGPEVETFLTHLAVVGKVAASTQNQARSALLFLYQEVLKQALPWMEDITPAQRPQRLPVVLTAIEVKAILDPGKKPARRRFATGLRCGLPARRP